LGKARESARTNIKEMSIMIMAERPVQVPGAARHPGSAAFSS
jgi:hypothetical protein